jgi:hypothetical protein
LWVRLAPLQWYQRLSFFCEFSSKEPLWGQSAKTTKKQVPAFIEMIGGLLLALVSTAGFVLFRYYYVERLYSRHSGEDVSLMEMLEVPDLSTEISQMNARQSSANNNNN